MSDTVNRRLKAHGASLGVGKITSEWLAASRNLGSTRLFKFILTDVFNCGGRDTVVGSASSVLQIIRVPAANPADPLANVILVTPGISGSLKTVRSPDSAPLREGTMLFTPA